MTKYYEKYKVDIPASGYGKWKVEKFTVSEKEAKFHNIRAMFSFGDKGRPIEPGAYTRLIRDGAVIMSDTPAEISDHLWFMQDAIGNVLLNGLGLGVVLKGVLLKKEVKRVIVNEISEDVIRLISPYFTDKRVTINHADAFTWKPNGMRFNFIWHDIWDNICEDNLSEMKRLHRKYGHYLQKPSYQGSWGRRVY